MNETSIILHRYYNYPYKVNLYNKVKDVDLFVSLSPRVFIELLGWYAEMQVCSKLLNTYRKNAYFT